MKPAVTAQFAVVPFGPVELEGFLTPDGEFRQSLKCTARALGMKTGVGLTRQVLPSLNQQAAPQLNPCEGMSLAEKSADHVSEIHAPRLSRRFSPW